jgi:hypothetical protein
MATSPRSPRNFFPADLTPLLLSGWQTNKFDKSIPFWAEVDGLQFTDTSIRRKPGRSLIGDFSSQPIRGLFSINEYDTKVLYIGDLTNLYRWKLDDPTTIGTVVGSGYSLIETGGASVWDNGQAVWDNGDAVWDEGSIVASAWSFTNFGTWVFAADNVGRIKVKKDNEVFGELFTDSVSGAVISNSGTGHAVGDTLTFTGGAGQNFAVEVTEINNTFNVTRVKLTNFGIGYNNGDTLTQSTTSGSGINLQLTITVADCPFTRVTAIDKSGPHILAINYDKANSEHPYDVAWCDTDNPDTWVAASANAAGSLTLREASSPLKAIVPLGDAKAIYTEDQMFILQYTGAPYYFGYKTAFASGAGAVSPRSVVAVDSTNYGLSRRGLFVTDGSSVETIGDLEGINKYIRDNIAKSEYSQVTAYHNKINNEVIWSLPINSTKPTKQITYNYSNKTFSIESIGASYVQLSGVFNDDITGYPDGEVFFEDGGQSNHATYGITKAHDLDDSYSIKEITSIRVGKIGDGNPLVEVGFAENINDEPTFSPEHSFYVNGSYADYKVRVAGRYLFLKISSDNNADSWEITNMEIKGRVRGFR